MRIGSASLLAALFAAEESALAYCQQTTEEADTCQPGAGRPISWPKHCLAYSINERGTLDVPFDQMRVAVRRSMDAWEVATRAGEESPCTDFTFTETQVATCERVAYEKDCGNVNLVVWREDGWITERGHDRGAIALSTIFFAANAADIVSTDLELNGEFYTFAALDDYTGCTAWEGGCPADIQNTVTHEAGHLLGLAHAEASHPEATMDYAEIPGDTNKRTLEADDVEGVCDMYPAGEGGTCNPAPPGGLDVACLHCDTGCCSTARGGPGVGEAAAVAAFVMAMVIARRSRR